MPQMQETCKYQNAAMILICMVYVWSISDLNLFFSLFPYRCHVTVTCWLQWEAQHEGASCEKFAQWKQDNDPDAQKQGLAAHLNANGIGKGLMLSLCDVSSCCGHCDRICHHYD